jgi:hypothetical protein
MKVPSLVARVDLDQDTSVVKGDTVERHMTISVVGDRLGSNQSQLAPA